MKYYMHGADDDCPYGFRIRDINDNFKSSQIVNVGGGFCISCKHFISKNTKKHIVACKLEKQDKIKEIMR